MLITVIYDNEKDNITYKAVKTILHGIKSQNINTSIKEFFITDKLTNGFLKCYPFCKYYCINKSNFSTCKYRMLIHNITLYLNKSDLIILASSAQKPNTDIKMYKLLEFLSYKWMPHKPNNHMVNKIALAISNTPPIIMFSHTNMIFSRILRFWGINKHSIFTKSLSKYNINNPSIQTIDKLNDDLAKISSRIVNKYRKTSAVIVPNFNNNQTDLANNQNENSVLRLPKDNSAKKLIFNRFINKKIL